MQRLPGRGVAVGHQGGIQPIGRLANGAAVEYDVFISYSQLDAAIVNQLEKLLELDGRSVFRDSDSIKPGQKWKEIIDAALASCSQMVVFWCCHAKESRWVEYELRQALTAKKHVVPVLLCNAEQPADLADRMWIRLAGLVHHYCDCSGLDVTVRGFVSPEVKAARKIYSALKRPPRTT